MNARITRSRAPVAVADPAAPPPARAAPSGRRRSRSPTIARASRLRAAVALRRHGDRARRAVQQPLAGAAGQHAARAAGVRGADDDQPGVLLLGHRVQAVGGRRVGDGAELDRARRRGRCARARAAPGCRLRRYASNSALIGAARARVVGEHVDEHELGAGDAGEHARKRDGVRRAWRLVDAHDDLAHGRPFAVGGHGATVRPGGWNSIRTRPHPIAGNYWRRAREPLVSLGVMTKIVVADDHAVVRDGLRLLLDAESDMQVLAESEDDGGTLRAVRAHRPDVLILDLVLVDGNGLETLPALAEEAPDTAVVVLTMHKDAAVAARRCARVRPGSSSRTRQARSSCGPSVRLRAAALRPTRDRRPDRRRRRPTYSARSDRARGRGAAARRARPHEPRGRRHAHPEHPDGRVAPRAPAGQARLPVRAELVRYALDHGFVSV